MCGAYLAEELHTQDRVEELYDEEDTGEVGLGRARLKLRVRVRIRVRNRVRIGVRVRVSGQGSVRVRVRVRVKVRVRIGARVRVSGQGWGKGWGRGWGWMGARRCHGGEGEEERGEQRLQTLGGLDEAQHARNCPRRGEDA